MQKCMSASPLLSARDGDVMMVVVDSQGTRSNAAQDSTSTDAVQITFRARVPPSPTSRTRSLVVIPLHHPATLISFECLSLFFPCCMRDPWLLHCRLAHSLSVSLWPGPPRILLACGTPQRQTFDAPLLEAAFRHAPFSESVGLKCLYALVSSTHVTLYLLKYRTHLVNAAALDATPFLRSPQASMSHARTRQPRLSTK